LNYEDFIFPLAFIIAPFLFAALGAKFGFAKSKIKQLRVFFTDIDDALYDDKVTEEEFRKIFESGRNLLS